MLIFKTFACWTPLVFQQKALHYTKAMPKNKKSAEGGKIKDSKNNAQCETVRRKAVYLGKNNEIMIKVLAKPNAKESLITGISEEAVEVQIGAPPSDGEANKELIEFLSTTLGLRKSDFSLEKGSRSREKTLVIQPSVSSVECVLNKLNSVKKS